MNTKLVQMKRLRRSLAVAALFAVGVVSAAQAATTIYTTSLDGSLVASPGSGTAQVILDDVAHTMQLTVSFAGLTGTTTAAHIHAATAVPGTGNAGVATTVPSFAGFPLGVSAGSYSVTLDMTQASSYNPSFVTANGGTIAGAEAALFASIAAGTAYLNIHTTTFGGGEIRGFFSNGSVANDAATWGGLKSSFR